MLPKNLDQVKDNISYRMYGFVPYNISSIQKGIQFGHGVVEYSQKYFESEEYQEWANNHKTFIILNGGTSNTMIENMNMLLENNISLSFFKEPDLNNMVSAVVFLVDSRVYDTKTYPSYYEYFLSKELPNPVINTNEDIKYFTEHHKNISSHTYIEWVTLMGGKENVFLREFLINFKLA